MKTLRPVAIVTAGPALLAVAVAAGTYLALPSSRHLIDVAWALFIGAAVGLAMFGPIAGMLAIGERHPDWLSRRSGQIGFYSSMAMALSMGYAAACLYHKVSDNFMLVAFAFVFFGATIKTALSYALRLRSRNSTR